VEKRRLKYPRVIVLVAVLTMMVCSSVVLATGPQPQIPATTCQLVNYKGDLQSGKFLTLSPSPMADSNHPGGYLWTYTITGVSSINQVSSLVPACFNSQSNLIAGYYLPSVGSGGQILDPGLGDPTTNFGVWDKLDYMYRLAYTGTTGYLAQNALTDKRVMSVQIKSGNNVYYCQNIAGPSCPKSFVQYAAPSYREILTDPGTGDTIKVCLMVDPVTGCESPVYCGTTNFIPSIPLSDLKLTTPDAGAADIVEAATPGTACATFLLRTPGDHSLWSISGGSATKVCCP